MFKIHENRTNYYLVRRPFTGLLLSCVQRLLNYPRHKRDASLANPEGKNIYIYLEVAPKRNLYEKPQILRYLGNFERFVPFHLAFVFS